MERVIEEIKIDGPGAKAVHRRSGENRDYDKEDLETFDSELTTPEVRVGGDRGLIKYECAICSETFVSSALLNLHKTNNHNLIVYLI